MVSFPKIEIASLVYAFLSVLATALSFLWFGVKTIQYNIAMANFITANETNYPGAVEATIVHYGMYLNLNMSMLLSIIMVFFVFSIILTKGLLCKNAHLVKVYFIYGVTMNTLTVLFALFVMRAASIQLGLLILFGCLLYGLVLVIIRITYLKLAKTDQEECCQKKLEAEKTISIRL